MDGEYELTDLRHFLDIPNPLGDDGSDFSDVDERGTASRVRVELSDTEESLNDEPPELLEPDKDDVEAFMGHDVDSTIPAADLEAEYLGQSDSSEDEQGIKLRSGKRSRRDLSNVTYLGMDQITQWSSTPLSTSQQTKRIKLESTTPGPSEAATDCKSELECWNLFFPDSTIDKLVFYTNIKIRKVQPSFKRARDAKETDTVEIKALLGLLYLSAVTASNRRNLWDLWRADGLGVEIFRLSMGSNRFKFLLQHLRFDDVSYTDRKEWNGNDKLHRFRESFEDFVQNCQQSYNHGDQVTVDEILCNFRGKCSFRVYHPKKPGKIGIKIWALTDTKSNYTSNIEVHIPNQAKGPFYLKTSPKEVVKRLALGIENTGRNITCDKLFTSVPLARDLLDKHLTTVGTIKKNHKEIPLELVTEVKENERTLKSSIFALNEKVTLVSYKPGRKKIVVLLSTLHNSVDIDPESGLDNKPSILTFYDKTKSAVSDVDAMLREFNVARISNRWPLTLFYFLMNLGGLNAFIIHSAKIQPDTKPTPLLRMNFLENLGKQLLSDNVQRRVSLSYPIPKPIKTRICEIFQIEPPCYHQLEPVNLEEGTSSAKTWRCGYCSRKKNRKTSTLCKFCHIPICGEHKAKAVCFKCEPDHVMVKPEVEDYDSS